MCFVAWLAELPGQVLCVGTHCHGKYSLLYGGKYSLLYGGALRVLLYCALHCRAEYISLLESYTVSVGSDARYLCCRMYSKAPRAST